MNKRGRSRNSSHIPIDCCPMSTQPDANKIAGTMCNYSSDGTYIESWFGFKKGSVLVLRVVEYPNDLTAGKDSAAPRSVGLAEVKWVRPLTGRQSTRFGIGLRYI